ncbi:hypothetical protein SBA1_460042 [Candidatus Sulfotelmatobacter kueseliae]|uniref:Uncharacterized protein n=1 Tax=Candidatus Sulfotelmatobacter kueseliae TaxID=2042962 RepID=A0A2U3KS01_9BACT|nr:hypothetical protein SBA1_460042 [Candidatus Sulfotelmatobacter kueseliae]
MPVLREAGQLVAVSSEHVGTAALGCRVARALSPALFLIAQPIPETHNSKQSKAPSPIFAIKHNY